MNKKSKHADTLKTPKALKELFKRHCRLSILPHGSPLKCELRIPMADKDDISEISIRLREQYENLHPNSKLEKGGIYNRVVYENDEVAITRPELIAAFLEQMDHYAIDKTNKCKPITFEIHRLCVLSELEKKHDSNYEPSTNDVADSPSALKEVMSTLGLNNPAPLKQLKLFEEPTEDALYVEKVKKLKKKKPVQDNTPHYKAIEFEGDGALAKMVLDYFGGAQTKPAHQALVQQSRTDSGSGLTAI